MIKKKVKLHKFLENVDSTYKQFKNVIIMTQSVLNDALWEKLLEPDKKLVFILTLFCIKQQNDYDKQSVIMQGSDGRTKGKQLMKRQGIWHR